MKTFMIYCSWTMTGTYVVSAANEDEARKIAMESPLPSGGDYLSESFHIDDIEVEERV